MPAKSTKKSSAPKEEGTTSGVHRLYRSQNNRIIAGVAGGLGEYFTIDPIIIRIIFVLLVISHGAGLLLYLILWLILPTEGKVTTHTQVTRDSLHENLKEMQDSIKGFANRFHENRFEDNKIWLGVLLVAFGIIFLGQSFGFYDVVQIGRFWPLLLILLGIIMLLRK